MDTPANQSEILAQLNEPEDEEVPPKLTRDDRAFLDHLKKINDTFYDQVKIADGKAAYIFTFMVAFLAASTEGRAVFDLRRYQTGDLVEMALSALLAASVLASVVSAILVVLPRDGAAGTSLYWNTWPANRQGFLAALEHEEPGWLFKEYLGNVDALAAIARAKYRHVAFAFRALLVTVLAYCLLLGWGAPSASAV